MGCILINWNLNIHFEGSAMVDHILEIPRLVANYVYKIMPCGTTMIFLLNSHVYLNTKSTTKLWHKHQIKRLLNCYAECCKHKTEAYMI